MILFTTLHVLLYLLFQLFLTHLQAATTVGELLWGQYFNFSKSDTYFTEVDAEELGPLEGESCVAQDSEAVMLRGDQGSPLHTLRYRRSGGR